jgi:hypothetical protein
MKRERAKALLAARLRGLSRAQVKRVFCESSGALVPKDKAVKKFVIRNMVESAAIRDLTDASAYEGPLPFRAQAPPLRASSVSPLSAQRTRSLSSTARCTTPSALPSTPRLSASAAARTAVSASLPVAFLASSSPRNRPHKLLSSVAACCTHN